MAVELIWVYHREGKHVFILRQQFHCCPLDKWWTEDGTSRMTYYICETCGAQLDDSKELPSACPIITMQSLPLAVNLVVGISKSEALFLNGAA